MKFLNIVIMLQLFAMSLYADIVDQQIIVTKTSNKSNLRDIKTKLDSVHVKMYVLKRDSSYMVYSQKFQNSDLANSALQRVQRKFPYARIISNEPKHSIKESGIFIGAALGTQSVSDGNSSTSGVSYTFETGYVFNKNIFASLTYLDASTSAVTLNNIYISANYTYNFAYKISAYAGGMLGYSTLKLTGDGDRTESSSVLFGGQIGVTYPVYEGINLYGAYQGISTNHVIKIDATEDLNFDFTHNIQIGVRYIF